MDKIKVAGKEISIKYVDNSYIKEIVKEESPSGDHRGDYNGLYSEYKNTIFINKLCECEDFKKQLIFHESIHALHTNRNDSVLTQLTVSGEEVPIRIITGLRHDIADIYKQIYGG